jgi:hypothetical protein
MDKLYNNYIIQIEDKIDNIISSINTNKNLDYVISVKISKVISKHTNKLKNDTAHYHICIKDNFTNIMTGGFMSKEDSEKDTLDKSIDHISLLHEERVKYALELIEQKLKERL